MGSRDKFTDEYRRLIAVLVKLRREAGKTQADIAEKMLVDQSRVSKYERCERRLDVIDFIRYCQAMDFAPELVFHRIMSEAELT